MRILHCPTDVGGQPWGLSQAEREIGLDSRTMIFRSSPWKMGSDLDLNLDTLFLPLRAWSRLRFFRQALREYDVFHFNFGTSLLDARWLGLHFLDLPILRRAGKGIVVTLQGCDVRRKGITRRTFPFSACHECTAKRCGHLLDRLRTARVKKIERYAHEHFVLNPDLMRHAPRARFLPYASVDLRQWKPLPPPREGKTLKVVHSPTNRSIKGTHYVIAAVERLRREGVPIELILVEGMSREEASRRYAQADVFVDQLLIGWYGSFGVEAMALARPLLCHVREEDLPFVPPAMAADLPIVRTTPQTLADDLRRIALDAPLRRVLGERGRAYVEAYHDPLRIARAMASVYANVLARASGKASADTAAVGGGGAVGPETSALAAPIGHFPVGCEMPR